MILSITLSGCSFFEDAEENTENTEEKPQRVERFIPKEVEIFDLNSDEEVITFDKTGVLKAEQELDIFPELNGKITDLNIKVGDQVDKGQIIARIGDSLNTDSIDLQAQTTTRSLNLSRQSLETAEELGNSNLQSAQLGADLAYESYLNNIQSRENTEETLQEQRNGLELSVESAEDSLDKAEDQRRDAKEALNDAEDAYEDYIDNAGEIDPTTKANLQAAIVAAEAQLEAARNAEDGAENGLEQAENGLEQFDKNYQAQLDSLDFAIESSYNQYLSALQQTNSAQISNNQQLISLQSQIAQAESAQQSAALNQSRKEIKAPISGVITSVTVEEGNNANPAQAIATIQNQDQAIVTTSINEMERSILEIGQTVYVSANKQTAVGEITSISPTLDPITRKITVEITINEDHNFIAGSPVTVEFNSQGNNQIYVPINSIYINEDKKIIKIVNQNLKVKFMEVTTGYVVGNYIEIIDGLEGDELVIREQTKFLDEGDLVEPL